MGEGIHQRYLKELCFQSSLEIECYDKLYQLPAEIADKPKTIILDCTQLEESIIGAHQLKQSGLIKLMALNFSNQPIHEDICHMLFDAGFEQIINKPLSINDLTSQIIKDNNWQPNWLNNITPFDKNISTKANVK